MSFLTCKEGHEHRHPAEYIWPREAPVTESLSQEVDCHPSVDGHRQENKESWEGDWDAHVSDSSAIITVSVGVFLPNQKKDNSLETKNMIPAAKERLNLSKEEKCAKDMMPAMMPAKHDIPERIMKALVAFQ